MTTAPQPPADPAPQRADVRLANEAWESVMTAHARLMANFAGEDMWSEVTMREYDVLYTLAKGEAAARAADASGSGSGPSGAAPDGAMRIGDLQGGVLLSQPALSRMVDRLVARGLLSRCADPVDGRAVRVSLTDEGRRVQRAVGRAHGRSVSREVSRALTPDEMRELRRLCTKLADS